MALLSFSCKHVKTLCVLKAFLDIYSCFSRPKCSSYISSDLGAQEEKKKNNCSYVGTVWVWTINAPICPWAVIFNAEKLQLRDGNIIITVLQWCNITLPHSWRAEKKQIKKKTTNGHNWCSWGSDILTSQGRLWKIRKGSIAAPFLLTRGIE